MEQGIHNRGAARIGEDLAAQADQTARRHVELEAHPARSVVHHLGHLASPHAEFFYDHAEKRLGTVDHQELERLV